MNPPPREMQLSLSTTEKLGRLHWVSYSLFTQGLVLFCVALSLSRNPYPWTDARIIATFVTGMVLLLAVFIYEWRFRKDGLLDHRLFQYRSFSLALLTILTEGVAFFAADSCFAYEVQCLHGERPVALWPTIWSCLFDGHGLYLSCRLLFGSAQVAETPYHCRIPALLASFICLAATYASNINAAFLGFAILLGAGLGIILPEIMVTAQLCTPSELISTASALVVATRSFAGTVSLAINNALFNSALSTEIPEKVAAATLPLHLPLTSIGVLLTALTTGDEALLAKVSEVTPSTIAAAASALKAAYGIAFRNCWIASCCFATIAIIGESPQHHILLVLTIRAAALFIVNPQAEFNGHIDAPAEHPVLEKQARLEGANITFSQPKSEHELCEQA